MYEIKRNKRIGIILFDSLKKDLKILKFYAIAHEYNLYIKGSDRNAQVRN